jgi:hypothetical protein
VEIVWLHINVTNATTTPISNQGYVNAVLVPDLCKESTVSIGSRLFTSYFIENSGTRSSCLKSNKHQATTAHHHKFKCDHANHPVMIFNRRHICLIPLKMTPLRGILPSSLLVILLLCMPITLKATTPLLDAAGKGTLQLQSIPQAISTIKGIVTIIDGPSSDENSILSFATGGDDSIQILCKGAALEQTSELERSSLAFCSLLSNAIIVNGVSTGELDGSSFRDSRHSRTLTTLFRAKLLDNKLSDPETKTVTTLIFVCDKQEEDLGAMLLQDVLALYQAAAAERPDSPVFSSLYDIEVTTDFEKVRNRFHNDCAGVKQFVRS